MRCKTRSFGVLVVVAVVVAFSARVAFADSPSALLEKAIYTEETVGDLDAAAKLYRQTVDEAKQVDAVAAKAQYRLGLCLLKQGKKKEGIAALEEVARRFPEQKEIAAEAKKHLPSRPGVIRFPVPWADGETLHYRLELGGGLEIGTVVYSAHTAELDGQKIWRFRSRTLAASRQLASRVDARCDDLRPISSMWNIAGASENSCQYLPGKVVLTTKVAGKETTRTIDVDPQPYDNEEGLFVFRCIPMAAKGLHETSVPIFASIGAGGLNVGLKALGRETVTVPAGKFECEKVSLPTPINQMFWFSADEHRYIVKMEANSVLIPLTKVEIRKSGQSQQYANADLGFSLRLPPDWYAYRAKKADGEEADKVDLLDPDADWTVALKTRKLETLSKEERQSPRAWVEKGLPGAARQLKDWKVRADSWNPTAIAGQPAVIVAGDYVATNGRPMTQFSVCVFGKTMAVNINADCPRDDLERLKRAIVPIAESLKVK
jgi:hypothetical protein